MNDNKIRVRLPNYTPAEEHFLLTLVKQKSNVVESNLTDSSTWVTKRKAWNEIDLEFTRKFGLRRGAKNLREKYVVLKRDQRQMERKKHLDRVAEIIGLTTDSKTSADSEAINTYETEIEPAKSGIIEDERLQDSESRDTEHPNQRFYSSSEKSIPNENVISYSPGYFRTNKESSTSTEYLFWEKEELRAAEKHRWDAERHKREIERHQWELERHKWKLKEHKLKEQILEQELKSMPLRASSRIAAGDIITAAEKDDRPKNVQASQEDIGKADNNLVLLRTPSTLLPQIKKEPTLEITDIPATTCNEIRTLSNATELRKRLGSVSADEHCAFKKLKSTQQVISEEHSQLEGRVLNNDTLDMNSTDGSFYDLSHLVNGEFDSDVGHNEYEDDEAYHALHVETGKAQDEHEFLQLLAKYKLRHYFVKLEELNIGMDCLKSISEMDIKDIFGSDIGARIRFRGLVEEWHAAYTNFNTTAGCQMGLDETATKRDIAELKKFIGDTHNSLLKAQQKTQIFLKKVTDEDLKSLPAAGVSQTHCQIGQNFVTNSMRKEVLPKNPYQTVSDFKTFEELLKNSKDLYTNLVDELTKHQFSNSVSFIKSIWRRIMTDNVAQHFCWNGTPEKTAIRTLCVTNALREAYLHKYNYSSNEEFQRTTISFFQYAKARRQLKENYEKFKAASLPL